MGATCGSAFRAVLPFIASCGGLTASGDGGAHGAAEAGAHTSVDGASGGDADATFCAQQTRAASALLFAAEREDGNDLSCQSNDDCKVVWRITACSDNCATLTTRTVEERIKAAIAEANATICPAFRTAGCRLLHPPCNPPGPWACRSGMCSASSP